MRNTVCLLALVLGTCLPLAKAGEPPKIELSLQQTERILAALTAATLDDATLAALPAVQGRYIMNLATRTGIHCFEPNDDESYHAITVMVGEKRHRQRHDIYFTVRPGVEYAQKLALESLLTGRTVTQYRVVTVGPVGSGNPHLFANHARNSMPVCDSPPDDSHPEAKH